MVDSPDISNLTQGGLANKQGRVLEDTVVSLFTRYGFKEIKHSKWHNNENSSGPELLIRDVPYASIYGHRAKTEFLAVSSRLNRRIRIECKWQQSPGSVDEKFPYLYLNCVFGMPEDEIVIILDGGGAKQHAVQWLRNMVMKRWLLEDADNKKTIHVFSVSEFITWANKTLR